MYLALKHLTYRKAINVLEMGSGAGTAALVALLDKKKVPYSYTAYENDKTYASKSNNVRTIMWSAFPSAVLPSKVSWNSLVIGFGELPYLPLWMVA